MKDVTDKNFGVIIAFLLPGFILLWGLSFSSQVIASWLARSSSDGSASVGGFLYATLASLALGLIISAARWLFIDHVLRWMGVRDPGIDFGRLKDKDVAAAFNSAVENHYRYYQYYSNTLVSVIGAFAAYLVDSGRVAGWPEWTAFVVTILILFLGSHDALSKFFKRAGQILA